MILDIHITKESNEKKNNSFITQSINFNFDPLKPKKFIQIFDTKLRFDSQMNKDILSMSNHYYNLFNNRTCQIQVNEDNSENINSYLDISFDSEDNFKIGNGKFNLKVNLNPEDFKLLSNLLGSNFDNLHILMRIYTDYTESENSFGFYVGSTNPVFNEYFKLETNVQFSIF